MNKYGVLIHGSGYEILDEHDKPIGKGFYVTVYVEATDVDAACQQAIDYFVNSEAYTTAFLPNQHPNGMLEIEAVDELSSFEGVPYPMSGFTIYKEDDTDIVTSNASAH